MIEPLNEHIWLQINNTKHEPCYVITSKSTRQRDPYYIYEVCNGEYKKLGKGSDPRKLEAEFVNTTKLFA